MRCLLQVEKHSLYYKLQGRADSLMKSVMWLSGMQACFFHQPCLVVYYFSRMIIFAEGTKVSVAVLKSQKYVWA